jgi:hypothetical protein
MSAKSAGEAAVGGSTWGREQRVWRSGRRVSGVSGVRSEPAEVWLNDGRPARFVWRGRLFTVLSVIERPAESDPGSAGSGNAAKPAEAEDSDWSGRVTRCWSVTASAGKNVPADTFRLCEDFAAGRWLLSRHSH